MKLVNGVPSLCKGVWTRQRGESKADLYHTVISEEHLSTVKSLVIDDKGTFEGSSDHNWMFLSLSDNFVQKKRISNLPARK